MLHPGRQEAQLLQLLGFSPSHFTPSFQLLPPPPPEPPPSLPPQSMQMSAAAKVKALASGDPREPVMGGASAPESHLAYPDRGASA